MKNTLFMQHMKFKKDYTEGFLWWKKVIAHKDKEVIIASESKFHYTAILMPEEKFVIVPKEVLIY